MKTLRRILTFLISLLALGMIASAGLAVTRPLVPSVDEIATSESDHGTSCTDDGTPVAEPDAPDDDTEQCQEGEGTGDEGDPDGEEGGQEEPAPVEDDSGGVDALDGEETNVDGPGQDDASGAVDPIREAACNGAAGVTPDPDDDSEDTADPSAEKPHGLGNAIAHVLENCTSNAQAPGLLVALRHLVANKAKHDAHDETKGVAKDKAKEKAKAKSHGGGGTTSQGAAPGNGASRGKGGPHGQGGSHGNGHAYGRSTPHGNPHGD